MSTPREDSNLFLLAVQQGELTQSQIDDCLRAWQDRHEAAAARALHEVAVDKGYLSPEKVRDLSSRFMAPAAASASRVSALVVMACPDCGKQRELSLEAAVKLPLCPDCSGKLRVSPDGPRSVTLKPSQLPPEVEREAAEPRNRFGKYTLLGRLGSGGMGDVFKAWDGVLQRPVAIKFPRDKGGDEIQRMYTEAQGAGRLAHPNIAAVYEAGQQDGRPYIAMQFIDGRTADDARRAAERDKGVRELARWIRDAALAAHYAHEAGVIHRDLKPSNLMIDAQGRVYVMDFGLAKLKSGGADATVSGMILGTPSFMPPEQASGRVDKIDARSDVYALGATLYVLLAGKKPYDGESATDILVRILTVDPVPLRQVRPELPWELEAIVEKAMRRNAEDRYASARELAEDLSRYLADEPVQARPASVTYRLKKKVSRHRAVIGASALAGLLGLALLAALLGRPAPPPADRGPAWRALFVPLQKALAADGFDAAEAGRLRAQLDREFPERKGELEAWIGQEERLVSRTLEGLPRERWIASRARVRGYRDWLAFNGLPTAAAERILAWRGTCTLRLHVHPYATLKGPGVDALPAADRVTPLSLTLEVVDGDLELSHPAFGARKLRLEGLEDGAAYVVEGTWKEPERIALRRDE